jgi:Domain of unknown function (DUF4397)
MARRTIVGYLSAAAVALAAIFVALPAGPAGASTPADGYVRGAHFSPDTASVDVYLSAFSGGTSTLWLSNVSYGDVSAYQPIAAGVYAVSMRPHGAAATTAPALTWTVSIAAGSAYTAAAVGTNGQLRGILLPDSLTPPAAGDGLVRVIQASSQAGHVSVRAENGPVVTADTAYGSDSSYVSVPAGHWTVQATSTSQPSLSGETAVSIASASATSVVVLDKAGGGLTLRTVLDEAGPGTIPSGSVSAGGGGTAPHSGSRTDALLSWVAFIAAGIVLTVGVGRARRRRVIRL